MRKQVQQVVNFIIGSINQFSIENRLLNAYLFIGFCTTIAILVVNSFENLPYWIDLVVYASCLGHCFLFYRTRVKKNLKHVSFFFFIFILSMITAGWLGSQGIEGAVPYFYFCCLVVFLSISVPQQQMYIILIVFAHLVVLCFLQYRCPEYILCYKTKEDRIFDLFASILICMFLISYLVVTLKNNYEKERRKVARYQDEILKQKNEIQIKNIKFTDSITYAQRIQEAILPSQNLLKRFLPEHFIFFKPCDIVSGDFYWFKKSKSCFYIAAADCTGHGVPGAFMSVLGLTMLDEIVKSKSFIPTNVVLNKLRNRLIRSLNQEDSHCSTRDGMDIALLKFDFENNILEYSGANIPLYLFKKDQQTGQHQLVVYRADPLPVGVHSGEKMKYKLNKIPLRKNETYYIFSDGYQSQFGGEKNSKFLTKRLRETLMAIQDESMENQKRILAETIVQWQGENEQIDDMLVIGIRISEDGERAASSSWPIVPETST